MFNIQCSIFNQGSSVAALGVIFFGLLTIFPNSFQAAELPANLTTALFKIAN